MSSSDEKNRTHFRLDVSDKNIPLEMSINGAFINNGVLKDISDGGVMFALNTLPLKEIAGTTVGISFAIDERLFTFELFVIRSLEINGEHCYAGRFQAISKLKKSQLSLLLMKLKLKAEEDGT